MVFCSYGHDDDDEGRGTQLRLRLSLCGKRCGSVASNVDRRLDDSDDHDLGAAKQPDGGGWRSDF
jgi:hypothetical protein